jgi:Uncharacterized protein conserved in bacteria
VIEKNRVNSARDKVGVRVNVVVVRDGDHAVCLLRVEQELIRCGCAEGRHFPVYEIGEVPVFRRIGGTNGKHFAKLEVRQRYRVALAELRSIFEPGERHSKVAALD